MPGGASCSSQRSPSASRWIRSGGAEPVDLHPQLRQRLLEHPCLAVRPLDQHRAVGDAAGEVVNCGRFVRRDMAGTAQVGKKLVRLFDVEGQEASIPMIRRCQEEKQACIRPENGASNDLRVSISRLSPTRTLPSDSHRQLPVSTPERERPSLLRVTPEKRHLCTGQCPLDGTLRMIRERRCRRRAQRFLNRHRTTPMTIHTEMSSAFNLSSGIGSP